MLAESIRIHINPPTGHMPGVAGWRRSREHSLRLADQEIWLVCAGRGWMQTRSHRLELHRGFCAWMRPNRIYDAGQDESAPLAITYIHFDVSDSCGRSVPASALAGAREFWNLANPEYAIAITRRIADLFSRTEKGARQCRAPAEALLKALLLDLVADTSGDKDRMPLPAWRRDILAAAHDDVLGAAGDADIAVGVHAGDVAATGKGKAVIQRGHDAAVGDARRADAGVLRGKGGEQVGGGVGGAVVHCHHLEVRAGLRQQAFQRGGQGGGGVPDGQHDADGEAGLGHGGAGW